MEMGVTTILFQYMYWKGKEAVYVQYHARLLFLSLVT